MKKMFILLIAVLAFGFIGCGDDGGGGGGGGEGGLLNYDPSLGSANIGRKGPGGGIIFYYDAGGFTVTDTISFTAHYLEAAPVDQEKPAPWIKWSGTYKDVTGAMGTAIGTGKANTAAIIAAHPDDTATSWTTANNAAKVAAAYNGGGKNDWFLPSKDELNELYDNWILRDAIMSKAYYWSSTQSPYNSTNDACSQNFSVNSNASQGIRDKISQACSVRAIRAF